MNSFICLLACVLLYFLIIRGIITHNNKIIIYSIITYDIFYDYIFIVMGEFFGSVIVTTLKLLLEVIIIWVYLNIRYNRDKIHYPKNKFYILICCLVYGIVVSFFYNPSIGDILKGFRLFFEPWIIGYILYLNGTFSNISGVKIIRMLSVLQGVLLLFSVYQYLYVHNMEALWFYQQFSEMKQKLYQMEFLYFRNGVIRASSFLDGPLSASILYSYFACIFFTFLHKGRNRIYLFVNLLLSIAGILLTNTRIGIVIFLLYIAYYTLRKRGLWVVALLPISSVIITFGMLILGYYREPSALGRLVQYTNFFSNFSWIGRGISDNDSLVKYDSFFISLFNAIGLIIVPFFYFFYFHTKKLYHIVKKENVNLIILVCGLSIVSLYTVIFQFYAGYAAYRFYSVLFFIALAKLTEIQNNGQTSINNNCNV